jgi:hypothetical protein
MARWRPDAHCGALIGSLIATQLFGKKKDLFHDCRHSDICRPTHAISAKRNTPFSVSKFMGL